MGTVGEGSAKLLLFGEHAAVHGYPALGIPLPWKTRVEIEDANISNWEFSGIHPDNVKKLKPFIEYLYKIIPDFKKLGCMRLSISSDIPMSSGFGSSSALCVAIVRACLLILKSSDKKISTSQNAVWKMANKAEKFFHGNPSGIDTGLSIETHMKYFQSSFFTLPKSIRIKNVPIYLIIGSVPRSSDTKTIVKDISQKLRTSNNKTRHILIELGNFSKYAKNILLKKNNNSAQLIGDLADKAHNLLESLGLGSPVMNRLINQGLTAGASGGKLSGAGCGGAFFLVAKNEEIAVNIADKINTTTDNAEDYSLAVIKNTSKGSFLIKNYKRIII